MGHLSRHQFKLGGAVKKVVLPDALVSPANELTLKRKTRRKVPNVARGMGGGYLLGLK